MHTNLLISVQIGVGIDSLLEVTIQTEHREEVYVSEEDVTGGDVLGGDIAQVVDRVETALSVDDVVGYVRAGVEQVGGGGIG